MKTNDGNDPVQQDNNPETDAGSDIQWNTPRMSADELLQAHNEDAPDTALALAGYIVGALMLRRYFAMSLLQEDKNLFWLVEDVANAIKEALPTLDMIELNNMAQAARKR